MASRDGGGGGLGWTVLGFLAGVAATLAVQTLMSSDHGRAASPEAAITHITAVQPETPQLAPRPRPTAKVTASSPPPLPPAAPQAQDQVADDAAAAGLTSRTPPSTDQNGSGN